MANIILDFLFILSHIFFASSTTYSSSPSFISLFSSTTLDTRPNLYASFASIKSLVNIISIAFDLPTSLISLYVPPAPGIVPNFNSGKPNLAFEDAIIISHIRANSKPPPSAYPETAAIIGFLQVVVKRSQFFKNYSLYTSV